MEHKDKKAGRQEDEKRKSRDAGYKSLEIVDLLVAIDVGGL